MILAQSWIGKALRFAQDITAHNQLWIDLESRRPPGLHLRCTTRDRILMLSGIGPREHLDEFAIDCILDSPGVGQNLADHPLTQVTWKTKPSVELDASKPRLQVLLRYTAEGSDLDNDMIVYMQHAASRKNGAGEGLGGSFIDPIGLSLIHI